MSFGDIGSWVHMAVQDTMSGIGMLNASRHSPIQKATWGDYAKADHFNQLAEQRAYNNAVSLFHLQQTGGPQLSMEGYRRAGLNPILAGGYNGSMPSASMAAASPSSPQFHSNAGAFMSAASNFGAVGELLSRVDLNSANAEAVRSRTEIENQLLEGKLALQRAELAYKSGLPEYQRKQIERMDSELLINQTRDALMRSNISLSNAREVSIHNRDFLDLERFKFDKDYRERYLKQMHEGYLGNSYFGKVYYSELGRALGLFGRMLDKNIPSSGSGESHNKRWYENFNSRGEEFRVD